MRISSFMKNSVKTAITLAIFSLVFFSSLITIKAQTTTFAQFVERTGGQDFVFTNNALNADFTTIGGGSPIWFFYSNINNLPAELQGVQFAHLFVTTTTTQTASDNSGTLTQPFNQTVTVQIIRDTPASVGTGSRTNLLTAVFSPTVNGTPGIVGSGSSATFSASTPSHNVTFTSDFLSFGLTTQRNLGFSFSSVTPSLAIGNGGFLQSFTAAATGTFASNPPPIYGIPTAAAISISGQVLTPTGMGLRNAHVVLIEADGTIHRTTTGSMGYYEFTGVESGQTVTVSVISKRYSFNSQIVSLQDNIWDLNFYPEF